MENLGLLLIIAVVGIVLCLILIVVGLTWKTDARATRPKAPAAAPAPAPASSSAESAPETGPRQVLRVLRDAATEALFVEVAGQRYARMADIHQAGVRDGLLATLRDLQAFALGAPAAPPVIVAPPVAPPAAVLPTITNVGAAKAAAAGAAAPPLLAPSMNPFKQMLVLRDLNKVQLPPMKDIAEQIDEILQEKLAGTPFNQRGIRVHTGSSGQALFRADGQDYEDVDSVPDDEVRGLIRSAVKAWEQKQ